MNEQAMLAAYSETALHRIGIQFERGMAIESVRVVVEAAALAMVERMKKAA